MKSEHSSDDCIRIKERLLFKREGRKNVSFIVNSFCEKMLIHKTLYNLNVITLVFHQKKELRYRL